MSDIGQLLSQNKLELLTDQNSQLHRQNELLKNTNTLLLDAIQEGELNRQQVLILTLKNQELAQLLDIEKRRYQQLSVQRKEEVRKLKEEMKDKNNYIERMEIEHQKQIFRMSEEIRQLKSQTRQKRQDQMEDLSRSFAVSCMLDMRGEENEMSRSNNYGNQDRSRSPINRSHISSIQRNTINANPRLKPEELMKYSKEEIKLGMKTLNKVCKNYREGCNQASRLHARDSQMRSNYN